MTTEPGWYGDGSGRLRWWDGQNWTDRYADAPQLHGSAASGRTRSPWLWPVLSAVGGAALLASIAVIVLALDRGGEDSVATPTETPTVATVPTVAATTASPTPAENLSTGAVGPLALGETAHFQYFDVTVDERRINGALWGAHVEVCYTREHPGARADGSTRVSPDPWTFGFIPGSGPVEYAKQPTIDARLVDHWTPVYGESIITVGDCRAGWLTVQNVEAVTGFVGMRYAPADFDFSATWRW